MSRPEVTAPSDREPRWTGDLRDDCTLRDGSYVGRAEKMDRAYWWAAVSGPGFEWNVAWDMTLRGFTSGEDARNFVEWLIGEHRAGRWKPLSDAALGEIGK